MIINEGFITNNIDNFETISVTEPAAIPRPNEISLFETFL